MKKWIALVVVFGLAGFAWWYAFDGSTPAKSAYSFRLDDLRAAAAAEPSERPADIAVEAVGNGTAPAFAISGAFDFSERRFDYASFRIGYADGRSVIVDTAADEDIAKNVLKGSFDRAAYRRMIAAMADADRILVTHEHIDHLPVVARYPEPAKIAPALRLTQPEIDALPAFAGGKLPPALANLKPAAFTRATRIGPGIAALQTPGHTEGHVVVFVQTADGAEYLLLGDIVWLMENVRDATTRPRFLQTFFFDPPEDRRTVQAQVRALHGLAAAEPNLVMLPAHDADHMATLIAAGKLKRGF